MKYLQALMVLLLALVLAGFIQQNAETTVLNYFGWHSVGLPLSLFMIIAFGIGYLSAVLIGFSGDIRSRFRLFRAQRETKRLKSELAKREEEPPGDEPRSPEADPVESAVGDEAGPDGSGESGTETI